MDSLVPGNKIFILSGVLLSNAAFTTLRGGIFVTLIMVVMASPYFHKCCAVFCEVIFNP